MKKELTLQRLKACVKNISELPESKFNFAQTVTAGILEPEPRGSVCCVFGWHPLWFPESGIRWCIKDKTQFNDIPSVQIAEKATNGQSVWATLCDFYNIKPELMRALTLPSGMFFPLQIMVNIKFNLKLPSLYCSSSKDEVAAAWRHVIDAIENGNTSFLIDN